MIQRYTHPEMGRIWSDQRRYETWLLVETAAAELCARASKQADGDATRIFATLFEENPDQHRWWLRLATALLLRIAAH